MAIGSRHIRHDYKTFVEWDQKSVRSMCGVTTKRHLAGIPGITEQPRIVDTGGKKVWGWCARCVTATLNDIRLTRAAIDEAHFDIMALYNDLTREIREQQDWMNARDLESRERRRRLAGTSKTL